MSKSLDEIRDERADLIKTAGLELGHNSFWANVVAVKYKRGFNECRTEMEKRVAPLVECIEKEIKRCGTWKPGEEALKDYNAS